ncbi:MAG TPA: DUF2628 domain-containing protein, partial [Methylocella sp.]|nr:DUF2628 domain-containing protein [Methylocella sp.]
DALIPLTRRPCLSAVPTATRNSIMALYSIYLRDGEPGSEPDAAAVCQAFSWKAFFLGPLWLAAHQLWAGLALWTIAYLFLFAAAATLVSAEASFLIALSLQILLGLEAGRLKEAKLEAQGFRLAAIVAARGLEEAELAFYRRFKGLQDAPADGLLGQAH